MTAPSLTDFLLARIQEDEEAARLATQGNPARPWRQTVSDDGEPGVSVCGYPADPIVIRCDEFEDAAHIARHDPARVLAECEAKRRIVEVAQRQINGINEGRPHRSFLSGRVHDGVAILNALAMPYADHPDFREEWRA